MVCDYIAEDYLILCNTSGVYVSCIKDKVRQSDKSSSRQVVSALAQQHTL